MAKSMTHQADIIQKDDVFCLSGKLNFDTVMFIYEKGIRLFQQATVIVDFAGLAESNSAGLALIVEWVKWSRSSNKEIFFKSLPPHLHSIAKVSGITNFIAV